MHIVCNSHNIFENKADVDHSVIPWISGTKKDYLLHPDIQPYVSTSLTPFHSTFLILFLPVLKVPGAFLINRCPSVHLPVCLFVNLYILEFSAEPMGRFSPDLLQIILGKKVKFCSSERD
jgi:hypothetical protein